MANELAVSGEGLSFILETTVPRTAYFSDAIFLPIAAWVSERTVLATLLDEQVWLELSRAYEMFARIRGFLLELAEPDRERVLDENERWSVEEAVKIVHTALESLLAAEPLKD